MVRTQLIIDGMTCENCVRHVGDALRALPGVGSVRVVLANKSAAVEHDDQVAPAQALLDAVGEQGYEARIATDDSR